jgi:ARC6-like, IMS domain
VADRSGIVQKLEDKVAAALRDHNLTAAAVGTPAAQSAMAEYDRLVKDAGSPVGIRYLALHSVAMKQGFYVDKRDQQEMLGTVSQEMGNMSPTEVLAGIKYLKSNYPAIYQCDAVALDRKESSIVELMTRLPMNQQNRAVAEAKNVQLEARPIDLAPVEMPLAVSQTFASPSQAQPLSVLPVSKPAPVIPVYISPPAQTYIPQQTQLPVQNNSNKGALIIGGGMVAGAIIFSATLISFSQNNKTPTSVSGESMQSPNVVSSISQDEAKKLIEKWMQAKQKMFAPPYDQKIGSQLTTGKAYRDKVRGPSSDGTPYSSLEWLRQYGFQYKYGVQNIENVTRFESGNDQASIDVQILEDARLYNKDGVIQPKRSGMERKTVRFMLKKDNGTFKISDYDVLGESKRKS